MTAGHYIAVEVRDGIGEPTLFTSELPAPLAPYAMALDAARPLSPAEVYRTDGKKPPEIKPFFEHQPVSTGAKRH